MWAGGDAASVSSAGLCNPDDVHLLTGLYGCWPLTNNISAINLANMGQYNIPMVDTSNGPPVAYQHDTTRGGPPGAALFNWEESSSTRLTADDPASHFIYIPFTIGLWVRLDDKASGPTNQSILTYVTGASTVRYRLHYQNSTDRFVFLVNGFSGTAIVVANSLGPPTIGAWYWIELSYDIDTTIARISVAPERIAENQPLEIGADYALVPGAILESGGALVLGAYTGTFCFKGAAAGLCFWNRALTDCERGRINAPKDYPFTTEAARFTEDGAARFTEDGQVRILE